MSATVYASSSNTNIALIVKIFNVAPDESAERITYGAILGSQSELDKEWSWTDENGTTIRPWPTLQKDEFLTPEEVYRFDIPLAARQWAVLPGHHLRLELTTQSPLDICPDEGNVSLTSEPCRLTAPQQETLPGGTYTTYFGPENPSAINLPQLPFNYFEGVRSGLPPLDWTEQDGEQIERNFTLPLDWNIDDNK